MKQFYEAYTGNEIVSALLTQLSWTNHLLIFSKTKTPEERFFYLSLAIKEKYSSRELERQLDAVVYERSMLSQNNTIKTVTVNQKIGTAFKDSYVKIADYTLKLPDNKQLQQKLHKLFENTLNANL